MRGWLANARRALALAGDRADLWPAGTLAWLAYLGWLPLVVALAPPTVDGVQRLGVDLYSSSTFPWNVVAMAAGWVLAFGMLCLLAAASEVALRRLGAGRATHGMARDTLSAFAVILVSSLPVVAAAGAALIGAITVAQGAFLSAEGTLPVLLGIASQVLPHLAALLLALVVMQAFAAVALRKLGGGETLHAMKSAASELRHRPVRRLATAGAVALVDAALLTLQIVLLGVLWEPIGLALHEGQLASPDTLLLLVGFVAIWLGLLLVAGALHAAASAWWTLELRETGGST
jgi:hypothetical protein